VNSDGRACECQITAHQTDAEPRHRQSQLQLLINLCPASGHRRLAAAAAGLPASVSHNNCQLSSFAEQLRISIDIRTPS